MAMTEPLALNRSNCCRCCDGQHVRDMRRVGTPTDPNYTVAVCPVCDSAAPAADDEDATASDE